MNTRKQLIELFITFNTLLEQKDVHPKFKYAAAKNLRRLENDIQTLMYIEANIEDMLKDYKQEYKSVIQKYGVKGDNGKFQIDVESPTGQKVKDLIEELNIKHKEVLDKYSESAEKYSELLNGEVTFDFISELHKLNVDHLPENTTKEQINTLIDFNLIQE